MDDLPMAGKILTSAESALFTKLGKVELENITLKAQNEVLHKALEIAKNILGNWADNDTGDMGISTYLEHLQEVFDGLDTAYSRGQSDFASRQEENVIRALREIKQALSKSDKIAEAP